MKYEISDDSGFIALVNVQRYRTFLSEDWDFAILKKHFIEQMKHKSLLIWSTGTENNWKVEIKNEMSDIYGFQHIFGQIIVDSNLFLVNYEDLSMVAQFSDEKLPLSHNKNQYFPLEKGNYRVKIIQMQNPEIYSDFVIEIEKDEQFRKEWDEIPWSIY